MWSLALAVAPAASEPDRSSSVWALVALLVVLGVALVMLAVWLVRATRVDPEVLAPLERMGERTWRSADPVYQRRELDELRPEGAEPLDPMAAPPRVDEAFDEGPRAPGFEDFQDVAPIADGGGVTARPWMAPIPDPETASEVPADSTAADRSDQPASTTDSPHADESSDSVVAAHGVDDVEVEVDDAATTAAADRADTAIVVDEADTGLEAEAEAKAEAAAEDGTEDGTEVGNEVEGAFEGEGDDPSEPADDDLSDTGSIADREDDVGDESPIEQRPEPADCEPDAEVGPRRRWRRRRR